MINSKPNCVSLLFLIFLVCFHLVHHITEAQLGPTTEGYTCSANESITTTSCQAYAYYRAMSPNFLDLASIADLFSVSRLMISNPSNISNPSSPLIQDQPLFVPLSCSCRLVNSSMAISFANLSHTIISGDTFYALASQSYQNLTTYQSVELVNPTLVATNLSVGVTAYFPVFCKCPSETQLQNNVSYLVSYVLQPSDDLSGVASRFGVQVKSIVEVNRNKTRPFDTIFVPVTPLPVLSQPAVAPASPASPSVNRNERKGVIIGLAVGLGITGFMLVLAIGVLVFGGGFVKKRGARDEEKNLKVYKNEIGEKMAKEMKVSLMADVSDCLDKYSVFSIDELREATNGFGESCLIEGSVYKGNVNGEVYAIKKMKWDACEELKILQKVNHGNLVKLEGFCIDPEDANCYLVYESVENGSLYSWLHENQSEKLSWKTRVHIASDVANGLQYVHEHTRPRVVHKDIKSANILLDSNMRAKIANFGLAKSGCNAITMHIVGTQGTQSGNGKGLF